MKSFFQHRDVYKLGPPGEILPGGTKTRYRAPSLWVLVENCIACLYRNQNIDDTTTMLNI